MSLRYRKRITIVSGLYLFVSSDCLCPTFKISGNVVRNLNRRGMEPDEITVRDLQDIINHIVKLRIVLRGELIQRQGNISLLRKRSEWLRPILTVLLQRKARARLDHRLAQELIEIKKLQAKICIHELRLEWSLPPGVKQTYDTLLKTFRDVALSEMIWNITNSSPVDQLKERSNAQNAVERSPVRFEMAKPCFLYRDDDPYSTVPQLPTGNGEALYLFPGILVLEGMAGLKVLSFKDFTIATGTSRFVETLAVPRDASIEGFSWLRENNDGSPDRRFIDNYQIPIARYGKLRIKGWDVDELYHFSSEGYSRAFGQAVETFKRSVA